MDSIRILKIIPAKLRENWSWISEFLDTERYQFTFHGLNKDKSLGRIWGGVFINEDLTDYDVVITNEYFTSFAINLKLKLLGRKADHVKHIAYGFNSSRSLLKTGIFFIDKFINSIFQRTDMFLTFSRYEQALFVKAHDLNIEKFCFTHWAYALPEIESTEFAKSEKPYVCMIGRNNRDFGTFTKALEGLDIDGVIIAPSYLAHELDVEGRENIKLYFDQDMNACSDCIKNALANIVLVNDDTVGAGHITIVISMLLGKTQIISDVEPIEDYFLKNIHGLAVPLQDANAVREAIRELSINEDKRRSFELASIEYARNWFSPQREAERLQINLELLLRGEALCRVDKKWLNAYHNQKT